MKILHDDSIEDIQDKLESVFMKSIEKSDSKKYVDTLINYIYFAGQVIEYKKLDNALIELQNDVLHKNVDKNLLSNSYQHLNLVRSKICTNTAAFCEESFEVRCTQFGKTNFENLGYSTIKLQLEDYDDIYMTKEMDLLKPIPAGDDSLLSLSQKIRTHFAAEIKPNAKAICENIDCIKLSIKDFELEKVQKAIMKTRLSR